MCLHLVSQHFGAVRGFYLFLQAKPQVCSFPCLKYFTLIMCALTFQEHLQYSNVLEGFPTFWGGVCHCAKLFSGSFHCQAIPKQNVCQELTRPRVQLTSKCLCMTFNHYANILEFLRLISGVSLLLRNVHFSIHSCYVNIKVKLFAFSFSLLVRVAPHQ